MAFALSWLFEPQESCKRVIFLDQHSNDAVVILHVDYLCIHLWCTFPVAATQSLLYPAEFRREELKEYISGPFVSLRALVSPMLCTAENLKMAICALAVLVKSQFGIWRSRSIVRAEPQWEQPSTHPSIIVIQDRSNEWTGTLIFQRSYTLFEQQRKLLLLARRLATNSRLICRVKVHFAACAVS